MGESHSPQDNKWTPRPIRASSMEESSREENPLVVPLKVGVDLGKSILAFATQDWWMRLRPLSSVRTAAMPPAPRGSCGAGAIGRRSPLSNWNPEEDNGVVAMRRMVLKPNRLVWKTDR